MTVKVLPFEAPTSSDDEPAWVDKRPQLRATSAPCPALRRPPPTRARALGGYRATDDPGHFLDPRRQDGNDSSMIGQPQKATRGYRSRSTMCAPAQRT